MTTYDGRIGQACLIYENKQRWKKPNEQRNSRELFGDFSKSFSNSKRNARSALAEGFEFQILYVGNDVSDWGKKTDSNSHSAESLSCFKIPTMLLQKKYMASKEINSVKSLTEIVA